MVNIHRIKQKIIIARRFIKSEMKKTKGSSLKIHRAKQGILNLQEKLRLKREQNETKAGRKTRKKGR
jgi:hypothetical protein